MMLSIENDYCQTTIETEVVERSVLVLQNRNKTNTPFTISFNGQYSPINSK